MPKVFMPPLTLAEYRAQMIPIPAGEFLRGSNDRDDEKPQTKIYLSAFSIGIVPVTVGMYEEFCRDTRCDMPEPPGFDPGWEKTSHSMVNVSWEDIQNYEAWSGLSLPSEAHWERAARGTDGRKYPWGDDWDSAKCQCTVGMYEDGVGTSSVGSYPDGASPDGVLDMAGNVWEWCEDWYQKDWYAKAAKSDPSGPPDGSYHVLRGGCWGGSDPTSFRSTHRFGNRPGLQEDYMGFRLISPGHLP
jgi:formylglycine-generating enzyme